MAGDFLTTTVFWEHRAQVKFDMDSIVLPSIHWLDRIIFYKVFVPRFKAVHVFVLISFIMKSKLVAISQAPSVGEAAYFSEFILEFAPSYLYATSPLASVFSKQTRVFFSNGM